MTQQNELAAIVSGHSDEEINKAMEEQGVDAVLTQVFDGMKNSFLPDAAAGQSTVIQYDVNAPGGVRSWQVKVAAGTCETTQGTPDTAAVTLAIALPDFLRLLSGELDGMTAFMSGKLMLTGDMMLATMMQSWFQRNP
jgi:putative sterol carrier protein